jgi:excisionase family DNA binding protein
MARIESVQHQERRAYTVREFCAAFRVSHSHVYKLFETGRLRSVRVGGKRLIPVEAAQALMNGGAND